MPRDESSQDDPEFRKRVEGPLVEGLAMGICDGKDLRSARNLCRRLAVEVMERRAREDGSTIPVGKPPHGDPEPEHPPQQRFVMVFSDETAAERDSATMADFVTELRCVAEGYGFDIQLWGAEPNVSKALSGTWLPIEGMEADDA